MQKGFSSDSINADIMFHEKYPLQKLHKSKYYNFLL